MRDAGGLHLSLASGGDSLRARDARVVVPLHPVEAFLEFTQMLPHVVELFGMHQGINLAFGGNLALDARGLECEITFQSAKLMFKINDFLLSVVLS